MSHDDEIPTLETVENTDVQNTMDGKNSKKYAKAMAKLGLKPEANILRASIKKEKAMSFAVVNPETYRFPGTNTFVLFGEFQLDDFAGGAQKKAAARTVTQPKAAPAPAAAAAATKEEAPEDAGDLQEKEINMVVSQANVTRNQAIRALKANNGDLVNTIMDLTQ
jgi:nascent polypeptide-associated complex subunit alpha